MFNKKKYVSLFNFSPITDDVEEKEKNKPPHKIEKYPYTIDEQKKFIINSLKSKEKISFVKLINDNPLKILVIYNFLAILELLQQVKIKISIGKGLNNFWLIKS